VTASYYSKPAEYFYSNGRSSSGRQGYVETQNYPTGVDGIPADSPVMNMVKATMRVQWPYYVVQNEHTVTLQCVLSSFAHAVRS
jgi:hypothetical protein